MQANSDEPFSILIVEDDENIRSFLETALRLAKFEIVTTEDGEQAIEMLEQRAFDVVLLDLMLPKIDGFGVLAYLRQTSEENLRSVVVMSAAATSYGFPEKLDHRSVHAVVSKPFDIRQLIDLLCNCARATRDTRAAKNLSDGARHDVDGWLK